MHIISMYNYATDGWQLESSSPLNTAHFSFKPFILSFTPWVVDQHGANKQHWTEEEGGGGVGGSRWVYWGVGATYAESLFLT